MKRGLLRNDNVIGGALALFALAVYAYTAMPSIPSEDSGEIATSLHVLGVVHPTGYPLFTLLGHAWADLPLGGRVIARLNLLMALIGTASVFWTYRFFATLLREAFPDDTAAEDGKDGTNEADGARRIAAVAGALALAFSRVAWTNAGSLEVYSLHLLFLPLVGWLFLKSLPRPDAGAPSARHWILFAYALGLSFSNHMMTVLLAPGFLFLYFATHGAGRLAWTRIALAVPPFLLGLTPYAYLPIRAAAAPLTNWGHISSVKTFLQHVSGAQYHHKMFTSVEVAIRKGKAFVLALPADFSYLPLALAVAGLGILAWRSRRMAVFTFLIFVTGAVYEANYDFPDANFRINAHFMIAFWTAAGILAASRLLARSADTRTSVAALLMLVAGAAPLSANFAELNRREEYGVEDYTRNVLASADSGAMLLTNEEWTVLFPAMYLQRVEGFRPDVAIVHPSAILNTWNEEYLQHTSPWVFEAAPEEAKALFEISSKIMGDMTAGDIAAGRGSWLQIAHGLVRQNLRHRPVHSTFLLFFSNTDFGNLSSEYLGLPVGLTFRLFSGAYPAQPMPLREPVFHPIRPQNDFAVSLGQFYADMYYNRGVYEVGFLRDTASAVRHFLKAQELLPGQTTSRDWLIKLGVWK
jgi:hypothetical protein